MRQVIVLTRLAQFKVDYPTKKQASKPALAAQYPVRQVVTFFHDNAPEAQLGGGVRFRYNHVAGPQKSLTVDPAP
jgi:hypothetical protein